MPATASAKPPPARAQRNLFRLDSPLIAELRGERLPMAFPFFALAKNAWMKPLSYRAERVWIEVRRSTSGAN